MVHCHHASIWHCYGDMAPQRQWGHEFDLSGSRDVIGHVTIRLPGAEFLWVVHSDHASIWHRYGDMVLHRVFTQSSKLPAKFQQTSSKHPTGLMEPCPLSTYQLLTPPPISCGLSHRQA